MMSEERARAILMKYKYLHEDGSLYSPGAYISWEPDRGPTGAILDGEFDAEELQAIGWWMEHKTNG